MYKKILLLGIVMFLLLGSLSAYASCTSEYKQCIIDGYNSAESWAERRMIEVECFAGYIGCVKGLIF